MPDDPKTPACPACVAQRRHTKEDWLHHPYVGHGYGATDDGIGWSHPGLEAEAIGAARRNS